MTPTYEYSVEQCDVPEVRRLRLSEYRVFRQKCLVTLLGDADTSVVNQVHGLTWHTAVFRTLNEGRRLEPGHNVNGAMWELASTGYAYIMAVGIRKLIDDDDRSDSLRYVVKQLRKRPELLTRENYVCHDGLPYDYEAVAERVRAGTDWTKGPRWMPRKGPDAYDASRLMHEAFDWLAGTQTKRKRLDTIHPSVLAKLDEELSKSAIRKVVDFTNRVIAHAERIAERKAEFSIPTYNDIDDALKTAIRIANFISSSIFYESTMGTAVPTPQFNVLEDLDRPWVSTGSLPALHSYWSELSDEFDESVKDFEAEFRLATASSSRS